MNNNKMNILFSSVGDKSIFYNYWLGSYVNYDIYINYTGNNSKDELKWKNNVNKIFNEKGFSFNILNNLYKNKEIDLEKYKYIVILNEFVNLQRYDISICFELMENHQLYFGSPTIEKSNNHNYKKILYTQKDNKIRFTNYVNIDMCFIKSEILIDFFNNYNNDFDECDFEYFLLQKYANLNDKIGLFDLVPYDDINFLDKTEKKESINKIEIYEEKEYSCILKKSFDDIKKTNDKFIIVKEDNKKESLTKSIKKSNTAKSSTAKSAAKSSTAKSATKSSTAKSAAKSSTAKSATKSNTTKSATKSNTTKSATKSNTTKSATKSFIVTTNNFKTPIKNLNTINKKFYKSTVSKQLTKKKTTTKANTRKKTTTRALSKKVEKNKNKKTYAKIKLL
jgi:hypothetical protein